MGVLESVLSRQIFKVFAQLGQQLVDAANGVSWSSLRRELHIETWQNRRQIVDVFDDGEAIATK